MNHYPSVIANLAVDVSERLGSDPAITAFTAISVITALIPDRYQIQIKANDPRWKESARLWIAIVGEPSTKKTPAMKEALEPLEVVQKSLYLDYEQAMEEYNEKCAKSKGAEKALIKKPVIKKVFVTDITLESLCDILIYNPDGVLAKHDELTSFFGAMDCYRAGSVSKDRPAWIAAYQGDGHYIDRVGRGHMRIPNFSVGILGSIQPDPLKRIVHKILDDDGLLQRFIPVIVSPATSGKDIAPGKEVINSWEAACNHLAQLDIPNTIKLSKGAQKVLDTARERIHNLGQYPIYDSRLKSAIQKGEGQLARITLAYHVFENACTRQKQVNAHITPDTAMMAAKLYLEYILPSIIHFYSNLIGETEEMKRVHWIAGHLLARQYKTVTSRDIYRANSDFKGVNMYRIQEAMEQLELSGWVFPSEQSNKNGCNRWYVNPRIYNDFKEIAAKEKQQREAVRKRISDQAHASKMSLEDYIAGHDLA